MRNFGVLQYRTRKQQDCNYVEMLSVAIQTQIKRKSVLKYNYKRKRIAYKNFKTQNSKTKENQKLIQNSKFKIQNSKFKTKNSKPYNSKFKIQNLETQD